MLKNCLFGLTKTGNICGDGRLGLTGPPLHPTRDRLGLRKQGILRQAEWVNDHFVDLTMNSVLRSEWKAQTTAR